jgi:hypothetical protein
LCHPGPFATIGEVNPAYRVDMNVKVRYWEGVVSVLKRGVIEKYYHGNESRVIVQPTNEWRLV